MANHPNRSGRGSSRNPKPKEIIALRLDAGLSQTAAAELVHTTCFKWQQWEADGPDNRRMHPAFWELFKIKVKGEDKELDE